MGLLCRAGVTFLLTRRMNISAFGQDSWITPLHLQIMCSQNQYTRASMENQESGLSQQGMSPWGRSTESWITLNIMHVIYHNLILMVWFLFSAWLSSYQGHFRWWRNMFRLVSTLYTMSAHLPMLVKYRCSHSFSIVYCFAYKINKIFILTKLLQSNRPISIISSQTGFFGVYQWRRLLAPGGQCYLNWTECKCYFHHYPYVISVPLALVVVKLVGIFL